MIKGYELIEKMYSEIDEYEDTRLYSTGNDELDDLLEKAFCEGYEYAQHEFSRDYYEEEEEKKRKGLGRKIAKGAAIGLGAVALYQGQHALRGKLLDNKIKNEVSTTKRNELLNKRANLATEPGIRFGKNNVDDKIKSAGKWIGDKAKMGYAKASNLFKK